MDATAELILAESPPSARRLLVIDAPDLARWAQARAGDQFGQVLAWCDDLREARQLPEGCRIDRLDAGGLAGVDLAWLRLPTSLGGLSEYAELLSRYAAPDLQLIAGGRVKHMTVTQNELLARSFGEVSASLAARKSRVLRAALPRAGTPSWPRSARHEDLGLTLFAHGLTFAGHRIDAGTRLLIDHLAGIPSGRICDLGSGNGVLAVLLARRDGPGSQLLAVDVSWSAVQATGLSAAANGVQVEVRWADGLEELPDDSLDVIVTNPPFHRGAAKDSNPTLDMFRAAHRVLRPGGQLWCVHNSHLPWRQRISELVGPTTVLAQNRNYTLVVATVPPKRA